MQNESINGWWMRVYCSKKLSEMKMRGVCVGGGGGRREGGGGRERGGGGGRGRGEHRCVIQICVRLT